MNDSSARGSAASKDRPGSAGEALARRLYERAGEGTASWDALPEQARAAWRQRARDSLAALDELGFRVELRDGQPETVGDTIDVEAEAEADAERLLRMGEPLLAYNTIQQAIEDGADSIRLRQLMGLALARSGAVQRANAALATLRRAGHADGETLGLLARTHKDLALAAADPALREQHLAAAFEIYESGYRESLRAEAVDDAYYTGINAAAMAYLRDDHQRARLMAAEVETLCRQALAGGDEGNYWLQATLAEAALLAGDTVSARDRYAVAAAMAGHRYGDLASTRHQARLLLAHTGTDPAWLDDAMRIPPVLVYTGHMIDAPGRASPRFPPAAEDAVRAQIRAQFERTGPVATYGSAACGTDILCLECMRDLGGELHIVLPFPAAEFLQESVAFRPDGRWRQRFESLLDDADEVLVISDQPPPSGVSSFEYANLVMTGLARLRAGLLETSLAGLAVWDGDDAGGVGGTASVVDLWRSQGIEVERIDPGGTAAPATAGVSPATAEPRPAAGFEYAIRTLLFADAVGYSRLSDEQIPLFFEHYLAAVATLNARTPNRAEHVETAGDGMYMVFADPGTAGRYALELSELVNATDWSSLGLPADMSVRIGLHCGPVFVGRDPITGRSLYSGSHTNRTARIEPITPPGQVYASSAFAAVASALGVAGLRFSYIGRTQLAKQYGKLALYHVTRP